MPKDSIKLEILSIPNDLKIMKAFANLCLEHKEFSESILMSAIKATASTLMSTTMKIKIEPVVLDFSE